MQRAFQPPLRAVILAVLAGLLLSACQPTRPDRQGDAEIGARAASLEAQGDYAGAAAAWRELADASTGNARNVALLRAARSLQRAGRLPEARSVLDEIGLPPAGQTGIDFALLSAEVAVDSRDYPAALSALDQLPPDLGGADKADALILEAEARGSLGQTGEAVSAMVRREAFLPASEVDDNRRKIWNLLQQASARGASMATPPDANAVVAGWMELGRMIEAYGTNPFQLQTALANWRELNPEHPASGAVLDDALGGYRELMAYPRQVALVLPLSGRLEASATAVRDGFIAAWFQQGAGEERPAIRVYDTARLGAAGAWNRAASDGADFVVGPLLKEEVAEIAGIAAGLETLALNEPLDADGLPGTVYRFALAPEDEASQAARRILNDGLYRGIALVPEGDWGMRVASSFGDTLQAGGGRLLDVRTFPTDTADFSDTITRLLHVDQSDARHAKLEGILGMKLSFEPRRRDDIDFIFLAAQPRAGRLIRPQLRFHHAADLPVYSTSAIYETTGGNNRDLDGVLFDDAPWVLGGDEGTTALRRQITGEGAVASARRGRLYALGFDAYRLVPLLKNDRAALDRGVPGMTGRLTLEDDGRIRRELEWARIVNGEPRPLSTAQP
jgi:outer membrane PBP1 activator LpoA protein